MSAQPPHPATPRTLAAAGLPRRVRKVLDDALALVSGELDPQLGAMLDDFEQELFRLADTSRNPATQGEHMHALRTLRLNRADLVPRVMMALEASMATVRQPPTPSVATPTGEARMSFRNLSLVDDAAMDEGTVLAEIASRVEGRATLPLHLLGQRFGVLGGTPALDAEHLPLGPRALCRAMREASLALQLSMDARLLLYRIFERHVLSGYARTMETLDAGLAEAGVLPVLTFVPLRARATAQDEGSALPPRDAAAAPAPTAARRDAGSPPKAPAVAASPATDRGADAMPRNDPQRPHTGWMGDASSTAPEDEDASLAVLQQLISGRRELLGKLRPGATPANPPGDQLSTQDVSAALGQLQALAPSAAGSTRSLQDIRQALLAQARQQRGRAATLSAKDNDSFELLNMLYAQIDGEIRADAPGAALLRRLQLPLLRVALQDRTFFVRSKHPARQLLNVVAESAARWLGEDDFDPQMLAPLQQAVSHVVEHYDGDDAVFAASNQQLEQHLQAQVRKAEMLERRHVEAARGKEKLAVAKRRAADTLEALIGDQRLAKFVRALLSQAWADVLTLTLLRQGEQSDEWHQQVEATRRIIAACGRGGGPPDPALRLLIESALAQVGYHTEEAEVIAQRLTSSDSEDEDAAASRTELAIRLKARSRLGEDAAQASRIKLPPRTPDEQARYEQLRVLPFGTWMEFTTNQQGDVVRRRMSWFSPVTDNALFVNQRGQRIGEQSLDSLARMLAARQVRIVTAERARLVDRAWQAAVGALRSFAGRTGESAAVEGT